MRETRKTLLIFKARWPEVALIVGLSAIPTVFGLFMRSNRASDISIPTSMMMLIFSLSVFALAIIRIMLHCGFQRTIYLYGIRRQSPGMLLKIGAHFFGRMFLLGLLVAVVYLPLYLFILNPAANYLAHSTGLSRVDANVILIFIPGLLLIKPFLFIPALILVLDCRIIDSFRQLKYCKLSQIHEAVVLYCFSFLLGIVITLGPDIKHTQTELYYCLDVAYSCFSSLLQLTIATLALRYVLTIYDNYQQAEPNESDYTYPQF